MGDLRDILDQMVPGADGHVPVAHDWRHVFDLAPFGLPFRKPAVQHGHIHLAHQPEGPPHTGRRKQARAVIDHHLMAIAHAHRAHAADEHFSGGGAMCGRPERLVGDFVNVEEARAGDMAGLIFGLRIAAHVGQIPAEASRIRRSGSFRCASSQAVDTRVLGSSAEGHRRLASQGSICT
jgi:hypothetical protein